jgi:hypothetical protein
MSASWGGGGGVGWAVLYEGRYSWVYLKEDYGKIFVPM